MKYNILFTIDNNSNKNYVYYAITTIIQMLTRTSQSNFYRIHLIVNGEIAKFDFNKYIQKNYSHQNYSIQIYNASEYATYFSNLKKAHNWTIGCYFRLLMLYLLPKDIEKLAFFDIDVYFNCDVAHFFKLNFDNKLILGQHDAGYIKVVKEIKKNKKICNSYIDKFLYLIPKYINAGVMLVNLKKLIAHPPQWLDEIRKGWILLDQDIINITMKGQIGYLPIQYGVTNCRRDFKFFKQINHNFHRNDILIQHMFFKPWEAKRISNFLLCNDSFSNRNRRNWLKIYNSVTNNYN